MSYDIICKGDKREEKKRRRRRRRRRKEEDLLWLRETPSRIPIVQNWRKEGKMEKR